MKRITIKETLETIKAMGLKARYLSEYKEYVVDDNGSTYHTDDAQDAIDTAYAMAEARETA